MVYVRVCDLLIRDRRLDSFGIFSFSFFFTRRRNAKLRCLMRNLTQRDNPTQFGRFNDRRGVTNCRMSIVLLDSDRFRPERNRIL